MNAQTDIDYDDGYEKGVEVTLDEALTMGQGHHSEGNFLLAERTYRDILKVIPDHYPTVHFLGILLYQMTIVEEAIEYLEKSVELAPDEAQCWNNLGAAYGAQERHDDALSAYDKALALEDDYVDAMNNKALILWLIGEYKEAEKLADQAFKIAPENSDVNITAGITKSGVGKNEEACDIWETLTKDFPHDHRIWTNWGNTLREMGKLKDAEDKSRKSLELFAESPEAFNNLGSVLRDIGRPADAIEYYNKATDLKPNYFQAHANKAIALCDQHEYEKAAVAARYAVAFKQDNAHANSALSQALRNIGEYSQARAASVRAIKAEPDRAEGYLDLADVNFMADFLNDAEAALEEALKRQPDSARSYKKLYEIKDKMGDHDAACKAIDKAIEMAPDMPILYIDKAHLLQTENKMKESFEAIDRAISLSPDWHYPHQAKAEMLITVNENKKAEESARKALSINAEVPGPYATLSTLGLIKSKEDEYFKKLVSMESKKQVWGLAMDSAVNYALSDIYERLKDYDKAFEHLKKANDYKRQTIPYDSDREIDAAQIIQARFTREFIEGFADIGCDSDIPVFIVGMPRSGTTLTEQIIASHPSVFGAGELMEIGKIRHKLGTMDEDNAEEFGRRYVENVKKRDSSGKALRITDKMPGNYMNIGLIASALPKAKIIHCGRNAADTCLSCYKQNFAQGQYWSYNLEELAAEHNRYSGMMDHWRKEIPDRFLDIQYEDTVGNFEEQARKLIDYVGLPWDDACLEPHKQKRAVLTASKAQVTKPVYQTSVEKWRRYEKHLAPLLNNLKSAD